MLFIKIKKSLFFLKKVVDFIRAAFYKPVRQRDGRLRKNESGQGVAL